MKKVYITSLHMLHGGVEMAITLLANALEKRGYEVEILCSYNLGSPVYKLNENVKITYLTEVHPNRAEFKKAVKSKNPFKILSEAFYAIKVLRLKKETLIDKFKEIKEGTIISTRNEHSVLLSKYGNENVKKIAQLHHDHRFDKKLIKDFKEQYDNIDYFVLLTDLLQGEVKEMMEHNKHTECITIPNFLESLPGQSEARKERQIVTVGRLHEVKGFDRLITMWKKMSFEQPIVLKIIGDGEEREDLQTLIRENDLDGKVVLTGAMGHEQVMKEMEKSLFYVMSSYSEGFPFVLIEAMANGLPAVAFDVRVGPRAIIEEGKSGYLIPDGNENEFIRKAELLAKDEELQKQLSNGARERSKIFTEESVMKKWIQILEA